jgi:hypothetical protein
MQEHIMRQQVQRALAHRRLPVDAKAKLRKMQERGGNLQRLLHKEHPAPSQPADVSHPDPQPEARRLLHRADRSVHPLNDVHVAEQTLDCLRLPSMLGNPLQTHPGLEEQLLHAPPAKPCPRREHEGNAPKRERALPTHRPVASRHVAELQEELARSKDRDLQRRLRHREL